MKLLIVEDNADIIENLYGFLEPLGYVINSAPTGFGGLALAAEGKFDVIVLDLMLPGLDGVELCKRLRQELRLTTPILMLTARDTVQDKLTGFDSGADDYLVKPFSLIELEARLKALVRRSHSAYASSAVQLGDLRFDPGTFEAFRGNQRLILTPTGYRLLECLLRAAPKVVTREDLEHAVWGESPPDSDALRTHIHAVRQAIDKPFETPMLRTVQGVGYRLVDPDAA